MIRLFAIVVLAALATLATLLGAPTAAGAATLTQVASFGGNPGALDMYAYVPDALAAGRPIVVVLHGCSQTAADMEHAGWDALADTYGFAVLYPQQRAANNALTCFDWFQPGDIARGSGEAASVMAMVDTLTASAGSDPGRVFVVGFSAGGAFAAALLAAYPDRFAAGSIDSGVVAGCATDVASAESCQTMAAATRQPAATWGDRARAAAGSGNTGAWPRVQIWQGSSDTTVAPANAGELVEQWTDVHGLDQTPSATDTIGAATRTQFAAGGTVVVEAYAVAGMGHDVAIGTDPLGTCPATAATYFADESLCSTLRAAVFFGVTDGTVIDDAGAGAGGTDAGGGHPGGPDGGGGGGPTPATGCGCASGGDRDLPAAIGLVAVVIGAIVRRRAI